MNFRMGTARQIIEPWEELQNCNLGDKKFTLSGLDLAAFCTD
jgi:hypothetical protein